MDNKSLPCGINGEKITRLEKDIESLGDRVESMDNNNTKILHSLDKNLAIMTETLTQTQAINERQDKRMDDLGEQILKSQEVMVNVNESLIALTEGQRHLNENQEKITHRVSDVEQRMNQSEEKHKIDTRDLQMEGYKGWLRQLFPVLSGGTIVVVIQEFLKYVVN